MANGFNPFAAFSTPEYQGLDLYTKYVQFNETFPNHPLYAEADIATREQMRNQVLGVESTDDLYKKMRNTMDAQGADSTTKNQIFNTLLTDDVVYQDWDLEDKRHFREKLVGAIDPAREGWRAQGDIAGFVAPEMQGTEAVPPRPLTPPTIPEAVENLTALAQRDAAQQAAVQQQQSDDIKRQIFERQIIPGGEPGRAAYNWALDKPFVRDIVGPWINRAVAIPGELTKDTAQLIAGVGEVQEETAKAQDALGWFSRLLQSGGRGIPAPPAEAPEGLGPGTLMFDWADEMMKSGQEWDEITNAVLPQRTVTRVEDINSGGDLARWVVGSVNDMGAFMAQVMVGKAVAGHPGSMIATAIPSIAEVSDEIYRESGGEIHPELALPIGMAIAGLEKLGFEQVTKGLTAPIKGKIRNVIVGRGISMLQGGFVEAGTEPTQEMLTIISGNLTGEEKKAWDGMSDEDKSRLVNSFWTGLTGGLVLSGGGGAYGQYMAPAEAQLLDQFREENPDLIATVEDQMRNALKLGGMKDVKDRGQALVNAARAQQAGAELDAGEAEVLAATTAKEQARTQEKQQEGKAQATEDILAFINRNAALRGLINDRDPAALAERLGVSEEEAVEIINAFAQEEVPVAQEEVQEEEALAEEEEVAAPQPIVDQFGAPLVAEEAAPQPVREAAPAAEVIPPEDQAKIDFEAAQAEEAVDEERVRKVMLAAERNKVKDAISQGAEKVKEIADKTGLDYNTVRQYANALADEEEVERIGTGSTTDAFRFVMPGADPKPPAKPTMADELEAEGFRYTPGIPNSTWEVRGEDGQWKNIGFNRVIASSIFTKKQLDNFRHTTWNDWAEQQAPPQESPTKRRMERMATRYRGLIAAATTTEEVNAVQKKWDAEKSKPWWMGVEKEFAARRALVVSEGRAAEEAPPQQVEEQPTGRIAPPKRKRPSPAEKMAQSIQVAEEATAAQRAVWDAAAGTQTTPEVARRLTDGIGEDGYTAQALAKVDPEIDAALKNADIAAATAILEGKAQAYRKLNNQKPLKKRKPKPKAPVAPAKKAEEAKKPAKKAKKAKKAKEAKLDTAEQDVLNAIQAGNDTVTKATKATGIPRDTVRRTFHALAKRGLVRLGKEKKEDGNERFVATPVAEGEADAAKKEYAEAKKKVAEEKKQAKEEEAARPKESDYERVKREFQAEDTPREKENKERKASSERGSIQLLNPKEQDKQDEDARRERSLWARRGLRDFIARGGKIFTEGGLSARGKMSKGQKIAWNELVAMIEAAVKQGQADFKMIDNHITAITRNPDKTARIGKVVTEYMQGKLGTTKEVANIINVPANSKFMKDIEAARERNSERHGKLMESELLPNRIKMLLADREFYLRRSYERFLRDKRVVGRFRRFKPLQEDVKEAIDLVNDQYGKQIKKLSKSLFNVQDILPKDFDFVGFLEGTNDKELLGQLDGGLADRLLDLRNQLQRWEDAVTIMQAETGRAFVVENEDALRDMAAQMVEVLLSDPAIALKQGGRLKIGNLKRRTLVDVFRKLYGEVYNPAVLQALTVEAQGTLIAQSIFFEQMQKHGKNLVWANGPDVIPGLTEQLGNRNNEEDVFRYGALTGKYVDPLFKNFLDRKGFKDQGIDELLDFSTADPGVLAKYMGGGFQKLQGVTRQFALTSVGAWTRNFVSSYAQFALQAGDVFLPGFNSEFAKGVIRSMKAIGGNEAAMREISDDMEKGAFRYTQTSLLADLAPVLKSGQTGADPVELGWKAWQKLKSAPNKLKEAYILIDYAAKKAAWEARYAKAKKLGKTDAVAAQYAKEHVAKYYQNAERVPEAIQALSKYGLTDFAGFKYDSGRMAVNAAINVGVSIGMGKDAQEGTKIHEWMGVMNEHPDLADSWESLAGFGAARVFGLFGGLWGPGQYLFLFGGTGKAMSMIGATLMKAFFRYHDEDDENEEISTEESRAMNEILPIYDANSQRWEYLTTNKKTGKKHYTIVPLGSQFGNYAEEMVIGLAQRMSIGGETPAEILDSYLRPENIGEVIPMGMTMSNLFELVSGYDPQTSRRQPSIAGALDKAGAPKVAEGEAIEALGNFFSATTGSFGRSYERWQTSERRAGREPQMGTYLKEVAEEPADEFLEWMGPIIRPLRPIKLDDHEILRRLGYKWSEATNGIMLNKVQIGTPVRKANQLGSATIEEQDASTDAERHYQAGLRDLAARIDKTKPVLKTLGIHEEQIVGRLRSVKTGDMQLSGKEINAIVYNKVDEYIDSDDYYEPDPTITPDQKGDTMMRVWLAKDPHMTQREIWNALKKKGYLVSDSKTMDKKFVQKYTDIKAEMLEKRRNGYF